MLHLSLDWTQLVTLRVHLQRILSDMSVEIAGTDRYEFREALKEERRVLQEILNAALALEDEGTEEQQQAPPSSISEP